MFLSLFKKRSLFVSGIGFEIHILDKQNNSISTYTLLSKEGLLIFDKSNTIDFSPIELYDFETYENTVASSKEEVILKNTSQEIYRNIISTNGKKEITFNVFNFEKKITNTKKINKFEIIFLIEDLDNIFQDYISNTFIKNIYLEDKLILSSEEVIKKEILKKYNIQVICENNEIEVINFN